MDVRQVAKLAHLEITEEEVAIYTPQLVEIVKYVEQLSEINTDDVEPMVGGLTTEGEATNTIREDLAHNPLGQQAALSQAPSFVEGHFRVPKVLS